MKEFGKELYFIPLGGAGEIGMNLNLYGYDNQWIIVDFGIIFGDELGIDVIMPDITFLEENKDKILGMLLTHAHEDHIGAIPYIWQRLKCPIYATPFTAAVVRGKLRDAGLIKETELVEVPVGGDIKLGPFDIEFINITHSIPEPHVLAIRTPCGTVVHTGDWKIDPHPLVGEATDVARLKEIGDAGVLALTCDSTNVFVEGRTESEGNVRDSMIDLVGEQPNRVIVTLFASNVARLETCAMAAAAHDRIPVLVGRSLERMYEAAKESGYLLNVPEFVTPEKAAGIPRDKVLYICTGSQAEPRAALSRLAEGTHPVLKLDRGDTVIFSSRKIPGNELMIGQLQNKLQSQGIEVISDGQEFTHVSGHPAREELLEMYSLVRPQILIPVHGEQRHMHEQAKLGLSAGIAKTIVPYNGCVIKVSPEGLKIVGDVTSGRWAYDGNRVVPLFCDHLRERSRVTRDGAAFVTLVPGYENLEPQISFIGLAANRQEEELLRTLALRELAGMIEDASDELWDNDQEIIDIARVAVRRAARIVCGRKPFVVTHILRV